MRPPSTIVEPFAGAAGYSTRYSTRDIVLVERDPVVAALWKYLTRVSGAEIRSLPLVGNEQTIDDLHGIAPEAKTLIGFWLTGGSASPRKSPSKWMRSGLKPMSYWGELTRARIASQVEAIRHGAYVVRDVMTRIDEQRGDRDQRVGAVRGLLDVEARVPDHPEALGHRPLSPICMPALHTPDRL